MSSTQTPGRYRDIRLLGAGGMATVTLAEDTKLGRLVALKRVHATGNPRGLTRLRREALVGASLNHPNLVSVYDVLMEDDGDLTIVMQYVAGNTLRDVIGRGIRPPREALRILEEVASGLEAIHARGIVHRDVKPANVLLGTDGAVKLADLGIAAVAERTQITTAGAVVGTFGYMAPEQLDGRASDPAVDIYALAAVAFEMLSGHKARPEANPLALAHAISTRPPPDLRDQWPKAPAEAAAVLQRGMAFDPKRRPGSASELVRRLGAALEPVTTESMKTVSRRSPPRAEPPAAPCAEPPAAPRAEPPAAPRAEPPAAPREPARVPVHRLGREAERPREPPAVGAGVGAAGAGSPRTPVGRLAGPRWIRDRRVGLSALLAVVIAAGVLAASLGGGGRAQGPRTTASDAKARHARPSSRGQSSSAGSSSAAQTSRSTANSGSGGPAASSDGNNAISAGTSPPGSGTSAGAATPSGAVESFYENAAHHDYAAAWRLADANVRNQLLGYPSFQSQMSKVRSITFHEANTLPGASPSAATVAIRTTAQLVTGTVHCTGTVRTRRSAGVWLLDGLSITCPT